MVQSRDIEKISLFAGLTDEELIIMANAMTVDTFPEGHVVYRENEVGCACIYIIRKRQGGCDQDEHRRRPHDAHRAQGRRFLR